MSTIAHPAALLIALVAGLAILPACQVNVNCPDVAAQPWWGNVDSEGISFTGYAGVTVTGTLFRPSQSSNYPDPRPVVVDDVGFGESECNQWWSAWALAGHGYVTLVFSEPTQPYQVPDTELAIDWLSSSSDPFLSQIDPTRLALVGHSAGAFAAQTVQAADTRVVAYAAMDNLTLMSFGCPDEPGAPNGDGAVELTPRVPGMGVARDSDCNLTLENGDPDQKLPGYDNQQQAGVPTAEFPVVGAQHYDFETDGPDAVHQHAFYLVDAWLDYWVAGDSTALGRITSTTWNGQARSSVLSPYYRSAIDIPAFQCTDLRDACPPGDASPGSRVLNGLAAPAASAPSSPAPERSSLLVPHPIPADTVGG
jgi:hypothetical protein